MKQPKADTQLNQVAGQARASATIRPSMPAEAAELPQPAKALPVLAVVQSPPPAKDKLNPPPNAIVLFKPTIMLGEYMFVGTPPRQEKKLTPEIAWIAEGVIVIDEMDLIIPLAGNYVRTTVG